MNENDIKALTALLEEVRTEAAVIVEELSKLGVGRGRIAFTYALTAFAKTVENNLKSTSPDGYNVLRALRGEE